MLSTLVYRFFISIFLVLVSSYPIGIPNIRLVIVYYFNVVSTVLAPSTMTSGLSFPKFIFLILYKSVVFGFYLKASMSS